MFVRHLLGHNQDVKATADTVSGGQGRRTTGLEEAGDSLRLQGVGRGTVARDGTGLVADREVGNKA